MASTLPVIQICVSPTDCDALGHVGQRQFVALFDRALWDALGRGPGVDVFARHGLSPVVRRATAEFHAAAPAGTTLDFTTTLTQMGRTSLTLQQTVRLHAGQALVAEAETVWVCLARDGKPAPVPDEILTFLGARPSVRAGSFQHLIVNDVATAVDVQGDGMAILFIHGFPLDRTVWRHAMAPLTGRRRIAPDLRGLGLSDAPASGYSIEQYADDMVTLLDLLNVETCVACGLSMGGYVAFDMVRRYRERVAGLILVNSRAEGDGQAAREARDEMIRMVEEEGTSALADLLVPKLLAPESQAAMPPVVERVRTMIESAPPAGVVGALRAMKERPDCTALLERIDLPTLVIAGREDQLIPVDYARSMAGMIPGAQFTLIPGAGHLVPMEQPVPTSRVIGEFLDALA
jgi:YbgC/YbaW family acyl-CoA thioester hydrolase